MNKISALLLASGNPHGLLEMEEKVSCKSMIKIKDKPLLAWVLDAVLNASCLDQIRIVGNAEVRDYLEGYPIPSIAFVEEGSTFAENLLRGFSALPDGKSALVVCCDIPFLTATMLDEIVTNALPLEADLTYPIVSKSTMEARFPLGKRTYVRMREDTYSGGNLVLLGSRVAKNGQTLIDQVFSARKSPFQLCKMLGWGFVIRLMTGRLSIAEAEERGSQILQGKARAFLCDHPEIAFDIDKPEDLSLVREVLAGL